MPRKNTQNSALKNKHRSSKRLAWALLGITLLAALGGYLAVRPKAPETIMEAPAPAVAEQQPAPEPPAPEPEISKATIQRGETISVILGSYISPATINSLVAECKPTFPLNRIRAGHEYTIQTLDGELACFTYDIDSEERLLIGFKDDGFDISREPIPYEVEVELIQGTITDSLFNAVSQIGESPELAIRLADIFAWDVDFIRDIRAGDSFSVLLEKRSREGQPAGYGRILAAKFENMGEVHYGFRAEEQDGRFGYFDENGKSLRKAFLKAPLNFTRISSGFTYRRLHPVKKIYRPHQGIDYAAPRGTPVKSVGDGVVTFVGVQREAGKMIKVRHNNVYTTYYMHLNGFARGIRKGVKVRQGQIIGYVGSTGLSTGPHLDFRIKKFGKYINPLKVESPSAEGIPKERMEEYTQKTVKLMQMLGGAKGLQAEILKQELTS